MPQHHALRAVRRHIPGLDPAATPLVGLGLGLTGLVLGLRPRLAAWPLALTLAAALLYRDPERSTPAGEGALYAPADGVLLRVAEVYEHRYLHTDAIQLTIDVSPVDVAVQRSPAAGVVELLEYLPATPTLPWEQRAGDVERVLLGLSTAWGPLLVGVSAGRLGRRVSCRVSAGARVAAGERITSVRLGCRVDLAVPRDLVEGLPAAGERLSAGITPIGQVVPL